MPENSDNIVDLRLDGTVLTVALNRPGQHNALNGHLVSRLTEVFKALSRRRDIRVVILTGNGRSFSAGADLVSLTNTSHHTFDQALLDGQALFDLMLALYGCTLPVIGRINGSAIGGGLGLVGCCDIIVATDQAKFGFSESRLGMVPAVISPFVVPKIGVARARELFLTGEIFRADFAMEIGLVHYMVSEERMDEVVNERVLQLLKAAPGAQAAAKKLLGRYASQTMVELRGYTTDLFARRLLSDEGQEGINAFLEKRKPNWK